VLNYFNRKLFHKIWKFIFNVVVDNWFDFWECFLNFFFKNVFAPSFVSFKLNHWLKHSSNSILLLETIQMKTNCYVKGFIYCLRKLFVFEQEISEFLVQHCCKIRMKILSFVFSKGDRNFPPEVDFSFFTFK
jgi:hypothetical protein